MPVPISSSKSQDLLTGLPEPPFVQAHFSIRIECECTRLHQALGSLTPLEFLDVTRKLHKERVMNH